jgi:hypothetical protein
MLVLSADPAAVDPAARRRGVPPPAARLGPDDDVWGDVSACAPT